MSDTSRSAQVRRNKTVEKYGIENVDDRVECSMCAREGCTYVAHNLAPHIKRRHLMSVAEYERALGLNPGTAKIVSSSVSTMLSKAGKRGAEYTNSLKRGMEDEIHRN